jgi:hypothetical protein
MDSTLRTKLIAELQRQASAMVLGRTPGRAVAALSHEAYEVATRESERMHAVGLTGLIEDWRRRKDTGVTAADVHAVLLAAVNTLRQRARVAS